MKTNNMYIPTITQPNTCPGCGKCNSCGRPYHEVSPTPSPLQPYWPPSQTFGYPLPTQHQGGQITLEQPTSGYSVWNSATLGIANTPVRCVAIHNGANEAVSYPEDK